MKDFLIAFGEFLVMMGMTLVASSMLGLMWRVFKIFGGVQ